MTTAYIIIAIGVVGVLTIVVSVYLHKRASICTRNTSITMRMT